jgi:hypothetical protein
VEDKMKRLATLALWALLVPFAHAETVLICHAQSVPLALDQTFKSPLSGALIEGVFDYYFTKGDIAFDTAFSLADGVPSSAWLSSLSSRYGADKVVYFQVIWKLGDDQKAVLDRVDYQVVGVRGAVLREGSFTVDLTSPSQEETKQVATVTRRILAGLSS